LIGIPSSRCICHTTGDPRAGSVCPVYCVKGSLSPTCVCDTNLPSYPSSQCMKDKICIFNLSQQTKEYCPCLMKGDPRAGYVCPSYCTSKDELTIDCMCELGSSYPQATCERDKVCIVDLIHQSSTICPCLVVDDPRGESVCNQTEQSDPVIPDPTDPIIPDPSDIDPEDKPDEEDMIKQEEDDQKEKQKEQSSTFQMIWISYIAEGILDINNIKGFLVDRHEHPECGEAQDDNKQYIRTTMKINSSLLYTILLVEGNLTLYNLEFNYTLAKNQLTLECICDPDSTSYLFDTCQKDKQCQFDLIHQIASYCPCLPTNDPRAGIICPQYCIKGKVTSECVCDTNMSNYSDEQCQQEKACKYDLIHQTNVTCPCLSTDDPRAGNACPDYCTAIDKPNTDCVCDSGSTSYKPSQCQTDKKCTVNSNQTVSTNSCTCTSSNYPSGCKCPTNSSELIGIPSSRCICHTTGDPRAGSVCPVYCVKGSLSPTCVCDTNLSSYPSSQCMKDKICIFNLSQQTKEYCPCLMKGDPRADNVCPSYCKSKVELTIECMCELDSSYPQATCERDKLCIVDLIHQSTSNCPCLEVDDPRGELICNQTEQSDPDPTDPAIPDPTEKDPETEQEQEEGIKQEESDKDETIKEQKSYNFVWIIIIVVGVLVIVDGSIEFSFGRRKIIY
ncbi:MAG: hypothetical protein EZS28_018510, partial [Streblomastix strix]